MLMLAQVLGFQNHWLQSLDILGLINKGLVDKWFSELADQLSDASGTQLPSLLRVYQV